MFILLLNLFQVFSISCQKDEFQPQNQKKTFSLPKLPYIYTALNPNYWDQMVYFHHDGIHSSLITSLNTLISSKPTYQTLLITDLLQQYASSDYSLWQYAGGHYSHTLFWWSLNSKQCVNPLGSSQLLYDINQAWGNFSSFQSEFNKNAKGLYGSGWVWLCFDPNNGLVIKAKSEEYNPLAQGVIPVLGIDVWEHSYEFFYRWDRWDYVDAWWEIVDWGLVSYWYDEFCKQGVPIPI